MLTKSSVIIKISLYQLILILLFLIFGHQNFLLGQELIEDDPKFGGPLTTLSFNKHGSYLSIGGGGTFITKGNFYLGVFGQAGWGFLERQVELDDDIYVMKSRQTGVWLGYKHTLKKYPGFAFSVYNKFGFGNVSLDNSEKKLNYYDSAIVFTPNLELSYRVTKYFELGFSGFYEIFTGVDFRDYSNQDFNSMGLGLIFKFKGTD